MISRLKQITELYEESDKLLNTKEYKKLKESKLFIIYTNCKLS